MPEDGAVGTVLGVVNHYDPVTTWLQLGVWITYLVVTLAIYFRPERPKVAADSSAPARTLA